MWTGRRRWSTLRGQGWGYRLDVSWHAVYRLLGLLRARGRPIIAKPQNHPAILGKDDTLTIMLDEPKPLEFT